MGATPLGGQPGGVGGALSRLFGGDFDPNLSPEQNDAARREGLLTAGLATILSERRGLAGIAEGAVTGRAAGRAAREREIERELTAQARDVRRRIFSQADFSTPDGRAAALQATIAAGDLEGAKILNDYIDSVPERQFKTAEGKGFVFDPGTGEFTAEFDLPEPPNETQIIQNGNTFRLVDKVTGDTIVEDTFGPSMTAGEARQALQDTFQRTDSLADDFRTETKGLQEAGRFAAAADSAPPTGAGDQTLVVALNKLLDPNSTVREGEFQRVAEIGGFTAKAQQFANRVLAEGQLSSGSREAIRAEIARLAQENQAEINRIGAQFQERAVNFGVNPNYVVRQGLIQSGDGDDEGDDATAALDAIGS